MCIHSMQKKSFGLVFSECMISKSFSPQRVVIMQDFILIASLGFKVLWSLYLVLKITITTRVDIPKIKNGKIYSFSLMQYDLIEDIFYTFFA